MKVFGDDRTMTREVDVKVAIDTELTARLLAYEALDLWLENAEVRRPQPP
jgi:hypothetical protein